MTFNDLLMITREQHEAMADVMQLRRLSENQRQRDKANNAIAVWWKVENALRKYDNWLEVPKQTLEGKSNG